MMCAVDMNTAQCLSSMEMAEPSPSKAGRNGKVFLWSMFEY